MRILKHFVPTSCFSCGRLGMHKVPSEIGLLVAIRD